MHTWGDGWEGWNDLDEAESFIWDYVYKHSWCKLMVKEKYGTLRYSYIFPPKSAIYVRPWTCIRIPFLWKEYNTETKKFYYTFDKTKWRQGYPIWRWCDSWLHHKWAAYGCKTLDKAIVLACRKWPQCREEIVSDWTWQKY